MGMALYTSSLPRPERRRSSLVSYHEENHRHHHHHPHRKRRRSEDNAHSLKHLPRVVCGGERYEDMRCFSRDEVINFIDETPIPSPMKSPRRASAVSLVPDVYEQHTVLFTHFPLTDFEREPQALRRLSEYGRSRSRGSSPDGSPGPDRGSGGEGSGACGYGKGCRPEHPLEGKHQEDELPPAGQNQQTGEHPAHRPTRTGLSAGAGPPGSGPQKHQSKAEIKGSTNSFASTPSAASSGYITFHSDSVGSTST